MSRAVARLRGPAWALAASLVALPGCGTSSGLTDAAEPFDLVVAGGRVIDPESGHDAVADVAIRDGRVVALGSDLGPARRTIDATGNVVAPGFIDLHVHGQDPVSHRYMARDGVTTVLELEAGVPDVAAFVAERDGQAPVHFGASAGHIPARILVKHGAVDVSPETGLPLATEWMHEAATREEIARIVALLERNLDAGALGIGMGLAYTPGAEREEVAAVFALAARRGVPVFVHLAGQEHPTDTAPALAAIALARETGASLHIVHLNSSANLGGDAVLAAIDAVRGEGLDVTTEAYPYTAASTFLQAALFDPGWRSKRGVDYGDLQWVATGERLTEESFHRYRKEGGTVILHFMDAGQVERMLAHPGVMVASDGMPMTPGAHPRGAGTHARVLAHYVRERGVLDLPDAIARMTLLPARRLERFAPAMRRKGRLAPGSDADIVVFDPEAVADAASFEDAMQPSQGIPWVLVGGTVVVADGSLVDGALPGLPIRAEPGTESRH